MSSQAETMSIQFGNSGKDGLLSALSTAIMKIIFIVLLTLSSVAPLQSEIYISYEREEGALLKLNTIYFI